MPATTSATHRAPRLRDVRRRLAPYVFLSPFLVTFAIFLILPLLYAFNLSLYRTKIIGGRSFVGLDNYVKAFGDESFWEGIGNVLTFGIIQIPVMLGVALVGALILDAGISRASGWHRLLWFLPFAVPSVVSALVWGYLYGQAFGPIAQIAEWLGFEPPAILSAGGVIPALANIATWQFTGYNMLILFAALRAIPPDLYEAARVDGASGLQISLRIRIPLISPAILLTFIFSIIGTLQLFNEPSVLSRVAPTVITPNFTPNLYVYNLAFGNRQFDYAAAISFSLAIVIAVLSAIVLLATRNRAMSR